MSLFVYIFPSLRNMEKTDLNLRKCELDLELRMRIMSGEKL